MEFSLFYDMVPKWQGNPCFPSFLFPCPMDKRWLILATEFTPSDLTILTESSTNRKRSQYRNPPKNHRKNRPFSHFLIFVEPSKWPRRMATIRLRLRTPGMGFPSWREVLWKSGHWSILLLGNQVFQNWGNDGQMLPDFLIFWIQPWSKHWFSG